MSFQRRLCMDATRISDNRPVMLKRLLVEEGPHELQNNRLFSAEPLASNPRNHCAPLLDVIELPNEPPIMVHPLLRPFHDPKFQTFGEFVTFFAQICEVNRVWCRTMKGESLIYQSRAWNSCTRTMLLIGMVSFFPPARHCSPF